MKKLKISLLTMAVVAGGAIGASAATAKTTEGDTFQVNLSFPSNAPLSLISVSDIPQSASVDLTTNASTRFLAVDTDGSGKIEGAGLLELTYGVTTVTTNADTNLPPDITITPSGFSDYIIDVGGKISTKNNNPNVQESIKGKGYSTTSSNLASIVNPGSAASSLSVTFTGNSAVATSNSVIAGRLKGSIKPGKVPGVAGGTGKSVKVDETATLPVDQITIDTIPIQVVAFGGKFDAVALIGGGEDSAGAPFRGSGSSSSSNNKFNASFKGLGSSARGSSFKLTGSTAPVAIITDGTNTVTFVSAGELKGKILGQSVDVKGITTTSPGGP